MDHISCVVSYFQVLLDPSSQIDVPVALMIFLNRTHEVTVIWLLAIHCSDRLIGVVDVD